MNRWEVSPYPSAEIKTPFEIGILLGGSVQYYDVKNNRPVYSQSVDRLIQTIELYNSGKIKKILLSGGSGQVLEQKYKESDYISEVLIRAGVNKSDIIIENQSRNTYENARFTAQIISDLKIEGDFLLITSAFHMRRSLACFKKAGVETTPYPVDVKSPQFKWTPDKIILPQAQGFLIWDQLTHEWFGMLVYRLFGYI